MKFFVFIVSALLITGCSAPSKELKLVENNCLTKMNGSSVFCDCMVKKIEQGLSDMDVEFIAAGFAKDIQKIAEIRSSMKQQDVDRLGDFMTKSVQSCSVKK